ncbi:MAG TPA: metallophosphoesterase, partial [Armatimonadota bacterium]|nr:metallophosphoesterase [Armatimonadota bacterium]
GLNETQWAEFFRVASGVLKDVPYYPAPGNHERNGAPYFRYFAVPRDYSFDYGNAHFVMLDSNRPAAELAAQDEWLRKDLAAHQGATWRIVAFHHTPYTCVDSEPRRVAAALLRARLEPIFQAGKVQLVINGHDHNYQHHFANGIHYVVTGGGGAPLYNVRLDTPFTKAGKKAHHECEITIEGKHLRLRAVEPEGGVIEEFEVEAGG